MIRKIKRAFKAAINTGKIHFVGTKQDCHFDYDFCGEVKVLDSEDWEAFEVKERQFRAQIASKRINHGDFVCKGDIEAWFKVSKILNGIFYQNNTFLEKKLSGEHWSEKFLKYVYRILRQFPRDDNYGVQCVVNDISYIEKQLKYIKETIRPFFSLRKNNNGPSEVSKEKLIYLWFENRKKAISVIKNDGLWPTSVQANISVERNEVYYQESSKCTLSHGFEEAEPIFFDRSMALGTVTKGDYFSINEIESIINSCPKRKSCGSDGVFYEDLKKIFSNHGHTFVNVLNVMLLNQRVTSLWKRCIIQRIPKKSFVESDLSTLRDISLLPTCYKILSKALCGRITFYIMNEIAFWQRAFLCQRDRQELIFNLKAAMDDFRHLSTKLTIVFIDFADAFGSVNHKFMFETLANFNIPLKYCCLIEDIYRYSSFSVICGTQLSQSFNIIRGTKTGDPLSALLFIMVIDRVCKPMVATAISCMAIQNERMVNPIPLQAFADDIAVVQYNSEISQLIFDAGEGMMVHAGLEVKPEKCAVLYARRSGSNWYKGKSDIQPKVKVQSHELAVCGRNTPYKYLGKSLSLSGEDPKQVDQIIENYKELLDKISKCKLPLSLKASAFNNMALAKILHHFSNTRFSEEQLEQLDKALTQTVRNLYDLYSSTTQLIIYLPREDGGIGIKRISAVYRTTRIAFLVKMLNHEEDHFRNSARHSLSLDMLRRGVAESGNEKNFLGYEITADGYLNKKTNFGCQSDWPDLLRYARKLDISIVFRDEKAGVILGGKFFDDTSSLQKILFNHTVKRGLIKANELSIQGCYFGMDAIHLKSSHSIFYNWKIDDLLVKFSIKARLSLLPTNFTLYIWNREHDPLCPFCRSHTESMAHLMNGCHEFRNFYSRRHNRIADKIEDVLSQSNRRLRVYSNKLMETVFTEYRQELLLIKHRKPDILVIDHVSRKCTIVEVTVCYDLYFDYAFEEKLDRYKSVCCLLRRHLWNVELKVMCFGSLGCIKKDIWRELRSLSVDKLVIKQTLQWCSISNVIMANYIWRHRVRKLFS